MAYTALQFLEKIKPMVLSDMRTSGILASLTAAQALIESQHGDSGLTQKANNLFGIKGKYNGQSVRMMTTEYVNGVKVRQEADFRKYPSWQESINDHSAMFNRMSRYSNLRGITDYKVACQRVEEDGYATSCDKYGVPNYARTLLNAITENHLYEWDSEVLGYPTTSYETKPVEPVNGNPYTEPTKNVRHNSKGNDVRWVQFQLNRHGYRLIVDGVAGDYTIGAVLDFQMKNGLTIDGIVGPATRAKLSQI